MRAQLVGDYFHLQRQAEMKHYLSICAIAKNEAAYLDEWIAYHLTQGVEHFYLRYDKDCEDVNLAKRVLAKWIGKGIAEVEYNETLGKQGEFYSSAWNDKIKRESQWCAFIDIDEFIWSDSSILNYMRKYEKQVDCINLDWILFGDSGHKTYSDDLVINRFTKHQKILDICHVKPWEIKTILQTTQKTLELSASKTCFGNHSIMQNIKRLRGNLQIIDSELTKFRDFELPFFALNHYYCKSAEEFEKKKLKGSVSTGMPANVRGPILAHDLAMKNKNDISTHSLAKHSASVKAEIEKINS